MGDLSMARREAKSQGFALIAALLLLFLLSGVAVGIMMLTNSEQHIGANDKEANLAYYGAESGMEKLTSDLAALYQVNQSPTNAAIQNLQNFPPTSAMIGTTTDTDLITFPTDAAGNVIKPQAKVISSGSNQGLTALIIPMTLQVSSLRPSGAAANMTRNVEVALIPVFQFGVFSESDLSYFNGPAFSFAGRIHTNGNFFPTPNTGPLVFGDKITVVGEVIRESLANGFGATPGGTYGGTVLIPNTNGGCSAAIAAMAASSGAISGTLNANYNSTCLFFDSGISSNMESCLGGIPPCSPATVASVNPNWIHTSQTTFNGYIGNPLSTGVKPLNLPFVGGGVNQVEIVRKPPDLPTVESATSALGASRMYNKANIRVLLASTIQNLHADRSAAALDAEDVDLGAASTAGTAFGAGTNQVGFANTATDANWKTPLGTAGATFPLVDGWIRVEYKDAAGNWHGITHEWLNLGFGRNVNPPTVAGGDGVSPNAILRIQEIASNTAGAPIRTGGTAAAPVPLANTSWYPINFYDEREGQVRDTNATSCTINGIMNAVEIDVGNLNKWIKGTIGASGLNVEYQAQNGYVLYFSDRRGEVPSPFGTVSPSGNVLRPANTLTGEYGFEDVINNATSVTGYPDGLLDSGEKVDINNSAAPDTWGTANLGKGFGVPPATAQFPYVSTQCITTTGAGVGQIAARANKVTGPRHVLRLIDGTLGNLPISPDGGGFSVASENPVYVLGDYNASATGGGFVDAGHAPAAILADAVTVLSNNWNDLVDMNNTTNSGARAATTTYYRMAIAAGKSKTFITNGALANDWGTDGGLHNFIRYLENWGGINLNYNGSLVSLYYSQYATGTFKCCNTVYGAPQRKYSFDTLFLNPSNLPPGTPMFQDIDNLSYRQDFTPY